MNVTKRRPYSKDMYVTCVMSSALHHVTKGKNYKVEEYYEEEDAVVITDDTWHNSVVPCTLFCRPVLFRVKVESDILATLFKKGRYYDCVGINPDGFFYTLIDETGSETKISHYVLDV